MTRGRHGPLTLQRMTLSFTTPRRFSPAHQERYHARQGTYADKLEDLDIKLTAPKYFAPGTITAGTTGSLQDSWTLTLTRTGASAGYGEYTVTFTQEGYDGTNSTIKDKADINPMQT